MKNYKWEKVEVAPSWNFKEEPEFVGSFISAESDVGPNKSKLYTFRKENGDIMGVWGNTILDSRFKNLVVGEDVKIIFKGKETSPKTGREYNVFEVFKSRENIPVIEEDEMMEDISK